jgi:predicted phosphodiesterase
VGLSVGATAIVHGHTHEPFVYRHPAGLLVISCGSAAFAAQGKFARQVRTPSCYGLQLKGASIVAVALLRPLTPGGGARSAAPL